MTATFRWNPSAPALIAAAATEPVGEAAVFCLNMCKNGHVRGHGLRTGRLRDSYTARPVGPGHWTVGSDLEYAVYVEYGTRNMSAQHHLRDAARATAAAFPGTVMTGA